MKNMFHSVILKILILVVVSTALLANPVYASTGDIWKGSINLGSVTHVLLNMPSTFLDLLTNPSSYFYEINEKGYDINQADAVFKANPGASVSIIHAKIESELTGTPLVSSDSFWVISID